jgi:hypothetical protein
LAVTSLAEKSPPTARSFEMFNVPFSVVVPVMAEPMVILVLD